MRILITGGAGFIGSHLADRVLSEGHTVVVVDNLITGSLDNIRHLMGRPDFTFIQQDISEPYTLEGELQAILHFASPASPIDYLKLPIETLRVGAMGTYHTLEIARQKGARLLLASTSEVYGDPLVHPQPEGYYGNVSSTGPRSCYDEAKRYAEAMVMAFQRTHGIDTRIVRIFNTFGERMRLEDGRVVPNFVAQAIRQEPLTVYGDGEQTRSFCYVSDLVEGVLRLLMLPRSGESPNPTNIGNPNEMTILQFAHVVNAITDNPAGIVFKNQDRIQDDPQTRRPDISRARQLLNWEPQVSLHEGLERTIRYFEKRIKV
ncbi:MAG: SDR family oxidoreductase [Anaerolinea sp.]|nr:SDR family oxidoreductase [Anaerolinea sp.]MCC6972748.1 SDR family oxidoreductase [Anaerolineae bacterium]CAG1012569.1 dTDP-glucose 4,6-dehydratase [Anaerolineae bacterium]